MVFGSTLRRGVSAVCEIVSAEKAREEYMAKRIAHGEEAITGMEDTRRYAEMHRKHAGIIYRAFLKDVRSLNVSGTCLEVGAGPGVLATLMAEQNPGIRVTAIDLSPDMVAVGEEYVDKKGLASRIEYAVMDVNDEGTLQKLGRFDLVYSTFSMHHWKDPVMSIGNLWRTVSSGGVLYLHDFKRVRWLHLLPLGKGDKESIRASYTPKEITGFLEKLRITTYEIRTLFPFFFLSAIARK